MWGRDGRELFFRGSRHEMMAIEIDTESGLSAGGLRTLFTKARPVTAPFPYYDVSPDGRFVMVLGDDSSAGQQQIHVVLNWFEELKRLVPTD